MCRFYYEFCMCCKKIVGTVGGERDDYYCQCGSFLECTFRRVFLEESDSLCRDCVIAKCYLEEEPCNKEKRPYSVDITYIVSSMENTE